MNLSKNSTIVIGSARAVVMLIIVFGLFTAFLVGQDPEPVIVAVEQKDAATKSISDSPSKTMRMAERFSDLENQLKIAGAMWGLYHNYEDIDAPKRFSDKFEPFVEAFGFYKNGEKAQLEALGGYPAFVELVKAGIVDPDRAVRMFAVRIAGISGTDIFVASLVKVIETNKDNKDAFAVFEPGEAAIAIGMIGAKEQIPLLAKLLDDEEQLKRGGAAIGLAMLGAKEYRPKIELIAKDRLSLASDQARVALIIFDNGN